MVSSDDDSGDEGVLSIDTVTGNKFKGVNNLKKNLSWCGC
jgi:hypothetical protein